MLQHSVEKSRFASPLAVKIGAVAALAGLAIACSASPSDPTTAKTSEEISCTSEGIHPETCGGGPIVAPTPKPSATQAPPPPPVTACAVDTNCMANWSTGFGAGPRYALSNRDCAYDGGFAAQLTSMGCVGAGVYSPNDMLNTSFTIAWCPHAPVDTIATWTVLQGCNTCTGAAPTEGWVLVAWANALCNQGEQPNSCGNIACLTL